MSDHQKSRFHKVLDHVLDSSPYARHVHDEYCCAQKFYKYTLVQNGLRSLAAVGYMAETQKLHMMLNMDMPDELLKRSLHHEFQHVHQIAEFKKNQVAFFPHKIAVTDYLAKSLMVEINAHAVEYEGPLRGFAANMQQGKMDSITSYNVYAESIKYDFLPYSSVLLNDPLLHIASVNKVVDQIGYRFVNTQDHDAVFNFKMMRQNIAQRFVAQNNGHNNKRVESYIGEALRNYQHVIKTGELHKPLAFYGTHDCVIQRDLSAPPTLDRLAQVITNKDDVFLTLPQWQTALDAKDNEAFVNRLMQKSPHKPVYQNIVEYNKRHPF